MPPWCPARILATRTGGFVTATSANLSGGPDPVDIGTISPIVRESVDLVMDLGRSAGDRPSTVVEFTNHTLKIVREGAIPESAMREFMEHREVRTTADPVGTEGTEGRGAEKASGNPFFV